VGANTGTGSTATYQPLSAGSTWKYRTDYSAAYGYAFADTDLITMGSKTLTINSKLYTQAYETHSGFSLADTGYYYTSNHDYSTMQKVPTASGTSYAVEFLYLKDNAAVGTTWSSSLSYPHIGVIALNGKITEKGISKTVAGKTFTNVIHTSVSLTMSVLGQSVVANYEIYVAQGVGIVHIDLNEAGIGTIPEDLISYNIK
jgi:hypothetical protein